ncbi:MAG: hypothetical protein Ct9H300mP16_16680 [Pseudomonadota bacterium]|nr:MAG: hypothetical protein Ct9H300mP16_16680 [Pseudomonadota bacterium]
MSEFQTSNFRSTTMSPRDLEPAGSCKRDEYPMGEELLAVLGGSDSLSPGPGVYS